MPFVTGYAPSYLTYFALDREATPGTVVVPGTANVPYRTIPLDKSTFEPEDKPMWLKDQAIRGSMADLYNLIQGVEISSWNLGGPFYPDAHGFLLDNLFGDKQDTNTSVASTTTATAPIAAGAVGMTLTSATGWVTGGYAQLGGTTVTTAPVEIVGPITVTGTAVTWTGPTRFAHTTALPAVGFVSAANAASTLTVHKFAPLNSGNGQPPTDTFLDYTGLGMGSGNTYGARVYGYSCVGQMDFTLSAEQLFTCKTGATSLISAVAGSQPVNTPSTVVPVPAWRGGVQLNTGSGYAPFTDVAEVTVAIKRELQVYFGVAGSQNPLVIARGPVSVTGGLKYAPSVDESALTLMLNNTQPGLQVSVTDAATNNFTLQCTKAGYTSSKSNRSGVLVGYDVQFDAVANTTDVGASGGLSPVTVSLSNFYPAY